jgi:uncharacterized protein
MLQTSSLARKPFVLKTPLAIAGGMVTALVATLVVWFSVVGLVGERQATTDYATQMLGNVLLGVVVGGAIILYAAVIGGVSPRTLALRWDARDTIFTAAMLVVTIGMAAATMLVLHRMGAHTVTTVGPYWGAIGLGLLGQLGVVHEELLFRWYVMARLRRGPVGKALVISAVLFALMHIPFKGAGFMVGSWVLGGLVYGYLYLKSGSLLVPLAAHAVHNWTLDLLMYSREGVSLVQFASTRLVGWEKIGFELALSAALVGLAYLVYGSRDTSRTARGGRRESNPST